MEQDSDAEFAIPWADQGRLGRRVFVGMAAVLMQTGDPASSESPRVEGNHPRAHRAHDDRGCFEYRVFPGMGTAHELMCVLWMMGTPARGCAYAHGAHRCKRGPPLSAKGITRRDGIQRHLHLKWRTGGRARPPSLCKQEPPVSKPWEWD